VHRFPENRGKRAAQAWGFERATTGLVVTVDSDTVVHPDALAEIIKPFADRRVNGVTGYARGLNRKRNLLTRLIDLRYTNAFLYERSAYSVLGSVLCATGVLSAWRRSVVMDNQEDYLNQRFLGTDVHYGDDRRLTAYALRTGRVVLQDSAIALTQLPERLPQFIRQQVRWNKSFFRESLLLLRQMRPWRIAWWLGLAEFLYWMVLTTMLLYAVVIRPAVQGVAPSWEYVAFVALMAYARSIRMIGDGGRLFPLSFLLAPLYGFMNLVLLVPLRLFSLLRLRDGSWGTRKRSRGIRRHSPVRNTAADQPFAEPAQVEEQRTDVLVPRPIAAPPVPCVQILPSR
jgi:hyaluronan synthase